jgi:hypothetical protein
MRCAAAPHTFRAIPTVKRFPGSSRWGEQLSAMCCMSDHLVLWQTGHGTASVVAVLKPLNRPRPSLPQYRYYQRLKEASNAFF